MLAVHDTCMIETVVCVVQVIIELAPLLSEADLHIAQLTLTLLTSIAELHPAALSRVSDAILPEILILVKSPLLQGI